MYVIDSVTAFCIPPVGVRREKYKTQVIDRVFRQ